MKNGFPALKAAESLGGIGGVGLRHPIAAETPCLRQLPSDPTEPHFVPYHGVPCVGPTSCSPHPISGRRAGIVCARFGHHVGVVSVEKRGLLVHGQNRLLIKQDVFIFFLIYEGVVHNIGENGGEILSAGSDHSSV